MQTEFRVIWPDGTVRWLTTHSSTIDWEGRGATLTFFTDYTEQRRMIEALHQSRALPAGGRTRRRRHGGGAGERFAFVNTKGICHRGNAIEDMMARGYLGAFPDDRALVQQRRLKRLAGESVPNDV